MAVSLVLLVVEIYDSDHWPLNDRLAVEGERGVASCRSRGEVVRARRGAGEGRGCGEKHEGRVRGKGC